jgi:hypothetical protein
MQNDIAPKSSTPKLSKSLHLLKMKFRKFMLSIVLLNAASLIIFQSTVYNFKCLEPFGPDGINGLTRDDSPSLAAMLCSMLRTTSCLSRLSATDNQMTSFANATLHCYVCVHTDLMLLVLLHLLLL